MTKVAFKYCKDYRLSSVESAIREAIGLTDVALSSLLSGRKILLKPNLLGAHEPSRGVTTHPIFIEAVIRIFRDYRCSLALGDSPDGTQGSIETVWRTTGMWDLCEKYGVEKKFFEREGAEVVGDFLVSKPVLDADVVINLPKFKTHSLTLLTAAVKNMFGIIPGLRKAAYHREAARADLFADYLVRIAEIKRPALNIIDGIVSMAGNGPSYGILLDLGLVAVSEDMYGLDHALANLVGIAPVHFDTLASAARMGFVSLDENPPVVGDGAERFDVSGFKMPVSCTSNLRESPIFRFILKRVWARVKAKPKIIRARCVKCGRCMKICPVSVIGLRNEYPRIKSKRCIECFCCFEICPEGAIELHESLALKLIRAVRRLIRPRKRSN